MPVLFPPWPLPPLQLLSYSSFLDDTRGASRLLSGLGGLWLYGLLHSATPLTNPLHEALLAGSPRLLYRCAIRHHAPTKLVGRVGWIGCRICGVSCFHYLGMCST
jgi:hypothetical protein